MKKEDRDASYAVLNLIRATLLFGAVFAWGAMFYSLYIQDRWSIVATSLLASFNTLLALGVGFPTRYNSNDPLNIKGKRRIKK
ncbi:MAG TPA: hypothetical protein VF596_16220 [Pyrinomonadaceae bacterium]|jgi:O-antigen/teichoic acid export membrane protein